MTKRKIFQEEEPRELRDPNANGRAARVDRTTTIIFSRDRYKTEKEFREAVETWKFRHNKAQFN
jgi:hypothetical protein